MSLTEILTLVLALVCGLGLILSWLPALQQPLAKVASPRNRDIDRWRSLCQWGFTLSLMLVAAQYALHVWQLDQGEVRVARPDVVDAFLPIAAGIQAKALALAGVWDRHHPAALIMLFSTVLLSILAKRAFCAWVCPLGKLGDAMYQVRLKLWQRPLTPPRWLDWPLRMLKYAVLGFLLYLVLGMPEFMVLRYLEGAYHQAVDLKMYRLFTQPTAIVMTVFAGLLLLSALVRNAFCRYLCPYGALLGLVSMLSPWKIRRNKAHCLRDTRSMDCDKCTRVCPARVPVHQRIAIVTDECNGCQRCVAACPAKGSLHLSAPGYRWPFSMRALVLVVLLVMVGLPMVFHNLDLWHSQTDGMMRLLLWRRGDDLPMF